MSNLAEDLNRIFAKVILTKAQMKGIIPQLDELIRELESEEDSDYLQFCLGIAKKIKHELSIFE